MEMAEMASGGAGARLGAVTGDGETTGLLAAAGTQADLRGQALHTVLLGWENKWMDGRTDQREF